MRVIVYYGSGLNVNTNSRSLQRLTTLNLFIICIWYVDIKVSPCIVIQDLDSRFHAVDSGLLDSGFQLLAEFQISCQWNLDSGF